MTLELTGLAARINAAHAAAKTPFISGCEHAQRSGHFLNQAKAQSGLGFLYYRGLGVMRDSVRAADWFRRAAEQGEPNAQLFLCMMHFFGDGVPRNLELALMWCELSLTGGQTDALRWREDVLENMTTAERDSAWRRTAEWYETHRPPRAD